MAKKIIYIVVGALFVFGFLFLLWSWFFSGSSNTTQYGSFGTSTSRSVNTGTGGQNTNGQTTLAPDDQNTNGTVTIGNGGDGSGNNGGFDSNDASSNGGSTNGGDTVGTNIDFGTSSTLVGSADVQGVDWLVINSGLSTAGGGAGSNFNSTGINGINSAGTGALPLFTGNNISQDSGLSLLDALVAAGITGAAVCGARAALATAQVTTGVSAATAVSGATTGATAAALAAPNGAPVADKSAQAIQAAQVKLLSFIAYNQGVQTGSKVADQETDFASCLVRTAAKAALNVMTKSIVNWINSGFNGQPSFVQNYTQFFTNVADQAAGEFIRGSGLAFLCTAFKPQIRIAIAQSYANRGAQSCSLSKIISNVNGFMNGNFAQGGWAGLVSFTTVPTNNPYGAYAYAQISLGNAVADAQLKKANELLRGNGFLDVTKQQNCRPATNSGSGVSTAMTCDNTIVTPGTVVASSLNTTLGTAFRQQELAKSFDEIINALVTQLMTKTLQSGLTSLSQPGGIGGTLSSDQLASLTQAQGILNDMQTSITLAQQYGTIQQGSIADIQLAQSNLSALYNCSALAASSTVLTPAQTADMQSKAAAANQKIQSLEQRVTQYNLQITAANTAIATVQSLQTDLSSAATPTDVQTVANNFAAAQSSHLLINQNDVTSAQQSRTTLQAEMASLNQSTQTSLNQCRALGQ